ncbi:MAG: bifunctional homocysteine S-methyltransferase/methylenetetrahydrofolate reductase [Acidobacteria bacterium]|nr:MAG: bifunctional homocysteine S-methyltransferase/methylenetetrahydrofolate reductase [Acidobacteriota bacterium]
MREPILQRLEKRPLVCDGAMGTMLYARGVSLNRSFDELNLVSPHMVKEVHMGYVKAGAELLETNTFGANRFRLAKFDLAEKVREINLAGARLARESAGEDLYVGGSVGPLGLRLEPLGPTSLTEARNAFREQVEALAEGGVDLIIIETMMDLEEAHQALLAVREATSLPAVVQMTVQEDGNTLSGASPEDFARQLDTWGADVIGVNCGMGPATVLETLERMATATTRKLSAQPNAGLPHSIDGRTHYLCSPEYMAERASRFIQAGARIVGGCCGTTPEHIKAIKTAVKSLGPQAERVAIGTTLRPLQALEPAPIKLRSHLAEKLVRGEFPVVVEIVPPKGCDPAREVEGAQYLKQNGIDAVNIPDGSGATARMSAQTLAVVIQQQAGIETLLHFSCRGRNVLSLQSDILGAHALGIRNVWAVTGDSPQIATLPSATAVFDVDAIGLVNVLSNLNRGLDMSGNPLGTQTSFLIGVGLNPNALDPDEELRRFEYKIKAGANFGVIRPVFDVDRLAGFLRRTQALDVPKIPLLAGIHPLTSYRNAEFLNNEVPGMSVSPEILMRMRKVDTGEKARAEGLKIAREMLQEVHELVQGVQIVAPFSRYAMAVEVVEALGARVHAAKGETALPEARGEASTV